MDDDNGGSLVDTIIAGVVMIYIAIGLVILFPLLPGGILGYEISKTLTVNGDIHKLSIIIGMVVNFFIYLITTKLFDIDMDKFSSKFYIYLFTIVFLMFLNNFVANKLLQFITTTTIEIIKFFLDFNRWFVDNTLINMGLTALYAYVSFLAIAYVIKFISDIFRQKHIYRRKYV